ncbi:MAG: ADP-ribosylglycohydrolase family protein [Bacteroidetes bacterium]|nr:ADP-ribosylglycohydrolase family protein [Bacteroidota bacterium]
MKTLADFVQDAFLGFATGDALGVPVEFETREWLHENPVKEMLGGMRYNQLPGTWSDDSSMLFCTAESLCNGYDLEDIALQYSKWKNRRYWTPHGRVFDIGIQTSKAIEKIDRSLELGLRVKPIPEQGVNEHENGNGSLMRILPLAFFLKDKPADESYGIIREVSALTHAHARAVTGCFIYIHFATSLLKGMDKHQAYTALREFIPDFCRNHTDSSEYEHYTRILDHNIAEFPLTTLRSSAYVLHTLEACLWCVMRNDNYTDTVLQAVNLGEDTDTVGALTGGLAGMIYGRNQMPEEWIRVLARKEDILDLAQRFSKTLKE